MKPRDFLRHVHFVQLVGEFGAARYAEAFTGEDGAELLRVQARRVLRGERDNHRALFSSGEVDVFCVRQLRLLVQARALLQLALAAGHGPILREPRRDYLFEGTLLLEPHDDRLLRETPLDVFAQQDERNPFGGLQRMIDAAEPSRIDTSLRPVPFFARDERALLHRFVYFRGLGPRCACSSVLESYHRFWDVSQSNLGLCPQCFATPEALRRFVRYHRAFDRRRLRLCVCLNTPLGGATFEASRRAEDEELCGIPIRPDLPALEVWWPWPHHEPARDDPDTERSDVIELGESDIFDLDDPA